MTLALISFCLPPNGDSDSAYCPRKPLLPCIVLSLSISDMVNYFRQSPRHWFQCPIMSCFLVKDDTALSFLNAPLVVLIAARGARFAQLGTNYGQTRDRRAVVIVGGGVGGDGKPAQATQHWLTGSISTLLAFSHFWFCCVWRHSLHCPDSIWQSPPSLGRSVGNLQQFDCCWSAAEQSNLIARQSLFGYWY